MRSRECTRWRRWCATCRGRRPCSWRQVRAGRGAPGVLSHLLPCVGCTQTAHRATICARSAAHAPSHLRPQARIPYGRPGYALCHVPHPIDACRRRAAPPQATWQRSALSFHAICTASAAPSPPAVPPPAVHATGGFRTLEALLRGSSSPSRVKRKALSLFMDLMDTQPAAGAAGAGAGTAADGDADGLWAAEGQGADLGAGGAGGPDGDLHVMRVTVNQAAEGGQQVGGRAASAAGVCGGGLGIGTSWTCLWSSLAVERLPNGAISLRPGQRAPQCDGHAGTSARPSCVWVNR